jgi:hypothetical protein
MKVVAGPVPVLMPDYRSPVRNIKMATPSETDRVREFPPSRPSKLSYAAGAVLFVLFGAFVMSQDPTVGTDVAKTSPSVPAKASN